jgi:hypothetical protein
MFKWQNLLCINWKIKTTLLIQQLMRKSWWDIIRKWLRSEGLNWLLTSIIRRRRYLDFVIYMMDKKLVLLELMLHWNMMTPSLEVIEFMVLQLWEDWILRVCLQSCLEDKVPHRRVKVDQCTIITPKDFSLEEMELLVIRFLWLPV